MTTQRLFVFDQIPGQKGPMANGKGLGIRRPGITPANPAPAGSPFVASGVNILPPGTSIGFHKHENNEEVYFIISGEGIYIDTEGTRHAVKTGDAAFCYKGESHALENNSDQPLHFAAAIVAK